jgi:hypothetical protein
MKVCYVDDSGCPSNDRMFVMVGVVADVARLNRTSREFSDFFNKVCNLFPENLKELKGSRILYGKGAWRQVDAVKRKNIFAELSAWLDERKHNILVAAVDTTKAKAISKHHSSVPEKIATNLWVATGLNIALQIQAKHRTEKNNKGNTFLFIDDNPRNMPSLCEVLWAPTTWLDDYYPKKTKEDHLNQLIDTAFAVQSHHCSLVQVADLLAFIIRKYFELSSEVVAPEWDEELDFVKQCIEIISPRIYKNPGAMKATNNSLSAKWYRAIAPDGYDKLLKGIIE